jgi:hypothetical protein
MATVTETNTEANKVVDLTSDEFLAAVEAGVFTDDRRLFLWEGRVCEKRVRTQPQAIAATAARIPVTELLG